MSADGPLTAELLCGHHLLTDFKSGDTESDNLTLALLNRVLLREADDFLAIVAVNGKRAVNGIVAATDLVLTDDESHPEAGGKWLFYYLVAIGQGSPIRSVWDLLLEEVKLIRRRRLEPGDYVGEVAVPFRGVPLEHREANGLTRFLRREGFRPFETNEELWFRRKDAPTPAA